MTSLFENLVGGLTSDNPLSSGATTINSAGFANLPTVTGGDRLYVTLDPEGVNGAPEIVEVTAHAGSASEVTANRAAQDTTARAHPENTVWVHALTRDDIVDIAKVDTADITDEAVTLAKLADAVIEYLTPAGTVRATIKDTADTGWVLDNQTIVDADVTYPQLWANAPSSMKSGSDLVIPDLSDRVLIGHGGNADIGEIGGSNSASLSVANLAAHTHAQTAHTHSMSHGHADTFGIGTSGSGHSHGDTFSVSSGGGHDHGVQHVRWTNRSSGAGGTDIVIAQENTGTSGVSWSGTGIRQTSNGSHGHGLTGGVTSSGSGHTHNVTGSVTAFSGSTDDGTGGGGAAAATSSTGSGTSFSIVQAGLGVRFQIKAH